MIEEEGNNVLPISNEEEQTLTDINVFLETIKSEENFPVAKKRLQKMPEEDLIKLLTSTNQAQRLKIMSIFKSVNEEKPQENEEMKDGLTPEPGLNLTLPKMYEPISPPGNEFPSIDSRENESEHFQNQDKQPHKLQPFTNPQKPNPPNSAFRDHFQSRPRLPQGGPDNNEYVPKNDSSFQREMNRPFLHPHQVLSR